MRVTIEGVVNSDVCGRGERHTVEWTERLRGLRDSRIIRVVEWHHDVQAAKPAGKRRGRRPKVDDAVAALAPNAQEFVASVES